MKRRAFFSVIASGLCFWIMMPGHRIRHLFAKYKRPIGLGSHDITTLSHIAEYIYPKDDESSGALSLGVENFFTIQMQTSYYKEHIQAMKSLVVYCDKQAMKINRKNFILSDINIKNEILDSLRKAKQNSKQAFVKNNFHELINLTLEGCFSHPVHGGNKEKQAWEFLGNTFKEEWLVG